MSKYSKDGPPPCTCPCHTGEKGFFHCFSVCCDYPDFVGTPPPSQQPPVRVNPFTTITFPRIKKVIPTLIAADIVAAAQEEKDDE